MRIIIECPENILHLEAGYIYADCLFAQLQPSCSPAADHTFSTVVRLDDPYAGLRVSVFCPVSAMFAKRPSIPEVRLPHSTAGEGDGRLRIASGSLLQTAL